MGDPRFPKWCEVFEEFVGVVYGLAVLSNQCVVFLGAHGELDGVSFLVAGVICGLRGQSYGCCDDIMPSKGWEVIEAEICDGAC